MLSALGNLWVARMRILEPQGQVRLGVPSWHYKG